MHAITRNRSAQGAPPGSTREQRSPDDPLTHSADTYIIAYIQIGLEEGAFHGHKEITALYEWE